MYNLGLFLSVALSLIIALYRDLSWCPSKSLLSFMHERYYLYLYMRLGLKIRKQNNLNILNIKKDLNFLNHNILNNIFNLFSYLFYSAFYFLTIRCWMDLVYTRGVQRAGSGRGGSKFKWVGQGRSCQMLNGAGWVKARLNTIHFNPFFKSP